MPFSRGFFSREAPIYIPLISSRYLELSIVNMGFSGGSEGKESACNAGDPGLIPGSGRSPGEGIGYPLQYSWASLVSQMVKKLPAIQETWVRSLGWEDPLEEGMATHSSIVAWRIPMGYSPWGHKESNIHMITYIYNHKY